jgi:hypothetical protein
MLFLRHAPAHVLPEPSRRQPAAGAAALLQHLEASAAPSRSFCRCLTPLPAAPRRVERSSQFVQRRIRLPDSADLQKIQAKMDNGARSPYSHGALALLPGTCLRVLLLACAGCLF